MERAASRLTVVMQRQADNGKCLQNIHIKIILSSAERIFKRRKIQPQVSSLLYMGANFIYLPTQKQNTS
jgi:hypothetical protein